MKNFHRNFQEERKKRKEFAKLNLNHPWTGKKKKGKNEPPARVTASICDFLSLEAKCASGPSSYVCRRRKEIDIWPGPKARQGWKRNSTLWRSLGLLLPRGSGCRRGGLRAARRGSAPAANAYAVSSGSPHASASFCGLCGNPHMAACYQRVPLQKYNGRRCKQAHGAAGSMTTP